ncbi:FtsX-like permease family protein, partial [Candidatus Poribacteria bacterium]|nr:FtsX-like permease family protein [Candidatus Poribacteria bacterium]
MCVFLVMTQAAARRETRRVMRDMGFNVRIVPRETDAARMYLEGYSDHTMPFDVVHRLAEQDTIAYNHLVATLQQRVDVDGVSVVLTGVSGELFPPGREKPVMSSAVEVGTVHVGYEVAQRLGVKRRDTLTVLGQPFRVARVTPQSGSLDDMRVMSSLEDAQRVLGLAGQVNEIKAIDCLCLTPDEDPQAILRAELERVAPEANVYLVSDMAEARARQRRTTETYARVLVPTVLMVCAAWLCVLSALNVRARRGELGVLRALGYGSGTVVTLFAGKAALVGLAAAAVGYGAGTSAALLVGPAVFEVTAKAIRPDGVLLALALLLAPAFTLASSFIPIVMAASQDPAAALVGE